MCKSLALAASFTSEKPRTPNAYKGVQRFGTSNAHKGMQTPRHANTKAEQNCSIKLPTKAEDQAANERHAHKAEDQAATGSRAHKAGDQAANESSVCAHTLQELADTPHNDNSQLETKNEMHMSISINITIGARQHGRW